MRLGRVEVTGSFLLLVAWLNYLDSQLLVPLGLLACGLHELGHWAALRCMGIDIKRMCLTAIGVEMKMSGPLGYGQECGAALAGPAVNLLLAWLFCRWEWGRAFAGMNLALACLNLAPVGQLDGGRACRSVLAMLAGPDRADRITAGLDLGVAAILLSLGFFLVWRVGNMTLLLVSLWSVFAVSGWRDRRSVSKKFRRKLLL